MLIKNVKKRVKEMSKKATTFNLVLIPTLSYKHSFNWIKNEK